MEDQLTSNLKDIARQAIAAGDTGEAILILAGYLHDHDSDAAAHALLGTAMDLDGQPASLDHLLRAAELEPGNPAFHFNVGHALESAGRLDQAADAYRDALTADPEYDRARFALERLNLYPGAPAPEPGPLASVTIRKNPPVPGEWAPTPAAQQTTQILGPEAPPLPLPLIPPGPFSQQAAAAAAAQDGSTPPGAWGIRAFYGVIIVWLAVDVVKTILRFQHPVKVAGAPLPTLMMFLGVMMLFFSGCLYLSARQRSGGWYLSVVILALFLLSFPLGTVVGALLLYLCFRPETRTWYRVGMWQ